MRRNKSEVGNLAGESCCGRGRSHVCGRMDAGTGAQPGAGSAGINQTENYTHSSAELAKEKYICHIALKPVRRRRRRHGAGAAGWVCGSHWIWGKSSLRWQMAENMGNCAKFNGVQKSIKRTQLTVASSKQKEHAHTYTHTHGQAHTQRQVHTLCSPIVFFICALLCAVSFCSFYKPVRSARAH